MKDCPENITTSSGRLPDIPYGETGAPGYINSETGQYSDYWVLSDEEKQKGFVRPLRRSYTHKSCGTSTKMSLSIAETYAREPSFYSATFCVNCRKHFPLDQFTWDDDQTIVGS